jgi:hypothetical protein
MAVRYAVAVRREQRALCWLRARMQSDRCAVRAAACCEFRNGGGVV